MILKGKAALKKIITPEGQALEAVMISATLAQSYSKEWLHSMSV